MLIKAKSETCTLAITHGNLVAAVVAGWWIRDFPTCLIPTWPTLAVSFPGMLGLIREKGLPEWLQMHMTFWFILWIVKVPGLPLSNLARGTSGRSGWGEAGIERKTFRKLEYATERKSFVKKQRAMGNVLKHYLMSIIPNSGLDFILY